MTKYYPEWTNDCLAQSIKPSSALHAWLIEADSLTAKAIDRFGAAEVQLLQNGWQSITKDTARRHKLPASEVHYIRKINMLCKGKACWHAISVIPQKTYQQRVEAFNSLGSKPLGSLLYADTSITRSPFYYGLIHPWDEEYPQNTPLKQALWARRSIFYIAKHPLYMLEIFFPAIEDLTNDTRLATS